MNFVKISAEQSLPRQIILLGDTSDYDCQFLGSAAAEAATRPEVEHLIVSGGHSFLLGDTVDAPPEAIRIRNFARGAGLNAWGSASTASESFETYSTDLVENFAYATQNGYINPAESLGLMSNRNRRARSMGKLVLPETTIVAIPLNRKSDLRSVVRESLMLGLYKLAFLGVERGNIDEILDRNNLIHDTYRCKRAAPKLVRAIARSIFGQRPSAPSSDTGPN